MKSQAFQAKALILLIIPFVLVIGIMLPRLIAPQFGLLDDAATLARAQATLQGNFNLEHDLQAGRFRPVYWLFPTLIYLLANSNPFWFFFGFLVIFLLLLLSIQIYMKSRGANPWQIFLASILFVLSIPVIENFYTLSKGEPLQLLFLMGSLILLEQLKKTKDPRKMWLLDIASFFCILFGLMVKETTLVMLPFALLILCLVWLMNKNDAGKIRGAQVHFTISVGLAVLVIFALRTFTGTSSIAEGTYSYRYQFSFSSILQQAARWTTLLAFYFHYLFVYGFTLLLTLIASKNRREIIDDDFVFWTSWCLLWVAVLIPWEYAEAYYLLPFGTGAAILIGFTFPKLIRQISRFKSVPRGVLLGLLILSGILWGMTIPNYATHARTQMLFDEMNAAMLDSVAETLPKNAHLLINIENKNEYVKMIARFLGEQYDREDITIDHVDSTRQASLNDYQGAFLIVPEINHQPRLTVRAGVEERFQTPWNLKSLEIIGTDSRLIFDHSKTIRLANINLPIVLCPILGEIGFCEQPDPLLDFRLFSYGWALYAIDS